MLHHIREITLVHSYNADLAFQVQPLEGLADLALPPHSRPSPPPVPVPARRSTSTVCAHGAPSRAPTQRSTPDAGANARSQPAL